MQWLEFISEPEDSLLDGDDQMTKIDLTVGCTFDLIKHRLKCSTLF
jgi:hypothetical protein